MNKKKYIDESKLLEKLTRMIDYCKTDSKVDGLTALFQVGNVIMDCPSENVVDKNELLKHQRKMRGFGMSPEDEFWDYAVIVEDIKKL